MYTRLVDKPIHDALRLVAMLLPYPIENLFVLTGNILNELCRKRATLSLARRAMDPERLLHDRHQLHNSENSNVPAALELLKDLDKFDITLGQTKPPT